MKDDAARPGLLNVECGTWKASPGMRRFSRRSAADSSEPDQIKSIGTAAAKNASMRYRVAAAFAIAVR
jgi:hypothetical protein